MSSSVPLPLEDATAADLAAWRRQLEGCRPGTIHDYVVHARQFYRWLADVQQYRSDNPADGLLTPPRPRRLPRPISEADLMLALQNAPERIRLWIVLAAWCGLRAKEIALLRRECLMLHQAQPVLIIAEDATKGHKERAIPLCPFVVAELAAAKLPYSGYLFRRYDGQRGPNEAWTISKTANRHLHACGIAATLHQLRHRFATKSYEAVPDIRVVQELLGHASPVTTSVYAAMNQASAARAVASLPIPA